MGLQRGCDVKGAGRHLRVCVRGGARECTCKKPPSASISGSVQAQCVQCAQLGWPPSAPWTRFPATYEAQRHYGREDVLLNRGVGLGKSAGRPFLPSSSDTRSVHFSSTGPQRQKTGREAPHTKSCSGFPDRVSPSVAEHSRRARIRSRGSRPCTDRGPPSQRS